MIEWIADLIIKRRLNKRHIDVNKSGIEPSHYFGRVLNCFRENKIMVETRNDGIYIRLAGDVEREEAFSLEWAKVLSFRNDLLPEKELVKILSEFYDKEYTNVSPKEQERLRYNYRVVEKENLEQIDRCGGSVEAWYLSGEGRLMDFDIN